MSTLKVHYRYLFIVLSTRTLHLVFPSFLFEQSRWWCSGFTCIYSRPRFVVTTSRLCYFKISPKFNVSFLFIYFSWKLRFLNPFGTLLGGAVVVLVFLGSVWAGENKAIVKNFKKKNPTLFVLGVMVTSYFLLSLCGGVMVFIFGITFPLLCKSRIPWYFQLVYKVMDDSLCCIRNHCLLYTVYCM